MNPDPIREATLMQRKASRPDASAVLRASAGSGKTKVLIDRLVRLMLFGAPLKSVVAMTFTRKAAVEIKSRLLRRVAGLARADEAARAADLEKLLGRTPSERETALAATLFEQILDDGAGLHIGTIHTFCQMLLSRFADEAGVDPGFGILENTDDLWEEALERQEKEAGADPERASAYAGIGKNPPAARKRLDIMRHSRMELDRWIDRAAAEAGLERSDPRGSAMLPHLRRDLARRLFAGSALADMEPELAALARPLAAASRTLAGPGLDAVAAAEGPDATPTFSKNIAGMRADLLALAERLATEPVADLLPEIAAIPLTGQGSVRKLRGRDKTKAERQAAFAESVGPLLDLLRLAALVELFDANIRLLTVGLRALDIYAELKIRDRGLDFHDLERRAWELLRDFEVGPWVVYRLDEALDHLLVDEFQDTNRNQWDVMAPFAAEFTAGDSPEGRPRSVFFVGDVKQSIYRFRGACPELFGKVAAELEKRAGIEPLTLPTNFRSLPAVVDSVGELFESDPLRGLLPDDAERRSVRQIPYRGDGPGKVTILPPIPDDPDGADGQQTCAAMTVAIIERILATRRVRVDDHSDRPARFGDILMLSRNRTHLAVYEKALRTAGVPFVPAGRGALARSREVADIRLLLRWLIFPQDDPALASVLRSPLMRVDERRLQALLAARRERKGSLWGALKGGGKRPGLAARLGLERETDLLAGWRKAAAGDAHALLRRIYRESDAPDRYHLALGEQARFNLLRLHDLALAHDQAPFPSPRRFLETIEQAAIRQDEEEAALPESDSGRVRMMTIHGAKGLEAPFVLLIDAAAPMSREDPDRVALGEGGHDPTGDGALLFGVRKEHRDRENGNETAVSAAAAHELERSRREEADLLYVALTRARDELFVLGAEPSRNLTKPSYLKWIIEARGGSDPIPDWLAGAAGGGAAATPTTAGEAAMESYAAWTPAGMSARIKLRHPSAAAIEPSAETATPAAAPAANPDAPVMATSDGEPLDAAEAADRGTRIHLWLQRAAETGAMPPGEGEEWEEARAVFANPGLEWVFRPESGRGFCEIPMIHRNVPGSGTVVEERTIGVIDRLIDTGREIRIVDYKSNRIGTGDIGRMVEHYRPQIEAYREAMAAADPDRPVRAWLLFTHVPGPDGPGLPVEVLPPPAS